MKTIIISDCCRKEIEGCGCGACLSARTCSKCKQPCNIWDTVEVEEKECCICGDVGELECSYCKMGYCVRHFKSTVMTGNCCTQNERDYQSHNY